MKIIARIPATRSFDLPAGQYKCSFIEAKLVTKQTRRGPQENVRLVFMVNVPNMGTVIPCAGRNFVLDLNPGSDLRNFLENWLGTEFFQIHSNEDLDFDTLKGHVGVALLSHKISDEYSKPFVNINSVTPDPEKPKLVPIQSTTIKDQALY